jgi:hypothetical protein
MKTKRLDVVYDISREYLRLAQRQIRGFIWAQEASLRVTVKDAKARSWDVCVNRGPKVK